MSAEYDRLVREVERINAKLRACEVVLSILRDAQRNNASNPYVVEVLQKLEGVLQSLISSYSKARQTRLAKLRQMYNM